MRLATILVGAAVCSIGAEAFLPLPTGHRDTRTCLFANKRRKPNTNKTPSNRRKKHDTNQPPTSADDDGNWIERANPIDTDSRGEDIRRQLERLERYSLGLSGVTFQTGPLSAQLHKVMMTRNDSRNMSPEVEKGYLIYAMDFSAKEATREALRQNGFELTLTEYTQDMGLWGELESVELLDPSTNKPLGRVYNSWQTAVEDWTPGQGFNFVVKNVPAKLSQVTLEDVLEAMDPDGGAMRTAKDMGLPTEFADILSLAALKSDTIRRCDTAPRDALSDDTVYKGGTSRGYNVIHRSLLLESAKSMDGGENEKSK